MKLRKAIAPVAALAVVGTAIAVPQAIFGAVTNHHFVGFAGGSAVKAVGATVTSGLTAQSSVDSVETGVSSENTAATVVVNSVLTSTNVTTSVKTVSIPGGVQIISHSITSGASLLNGAITVGAVDTVNTTTVLDNAAKTTTNSIQTTFVNLKVGSMKIAATVPQNTHITLPGIANVYLNGSFVGQGPAGSGSIFTFGAGLYVSLLKSAGPSPLGTEIFLNPVYTAVETVTPEETPLIFGNAYGTKVTVAAGKLLNAESGPSAQISQPFSGTQGQDKVNSTTFINLGQVAQTGVISSVANGFKSKTAQSYSRMTTNLAHINLLNGLITADALSGQAFAAVNPDGSTTTQTATSLVNLVIAGHAIPVNVSPNTVINILNVAKVTIRQESKSPFAAAVKVLDIVITTASYGLPVGAEIQVGVANAGVQPFNASAP